MAESKKYYWLKLKSDFFDDDTIKYIEEQENGIKYSNFYLKLCLKSLKTNGKLIRLVGETLIPYDINSLSKLTGVDFDTVRSAMHIFESIGLVKLLDSGEIYLSQINELIGSETDKAQIMRRIRAEKKLYGNNVTRMLPYIEKEIDIEKEKEIDIDAEIKNKCSDTANPPLKKNVKKESKKEKTFNEIIDNFTDNSELRIELKNHLAVRKLKKGSLTNRAIELELKTLSKLSDNTDIQLEIVRQSIEKGWIGFFPVKNNLEANSKVLNGNPFFDMLREEGKM